MSTNPPSDLTVKYYDTHAARYAEETLGLDLRGLYESFLDLIPPGGHILDAGCGSGRDCLAFLRRGYTVTAFDASAEMARVARLVTGLPVAVLRFQEVEYEARFDAIWACASLLHIPRAEIDDVFTRLARSLRPGGIWYMTFKAGNVEEIRGGRFFNDCTEPLLHATIDKQPALIVLRIWSTRDLRPDRAEAIWINALVKKVTA
jgi:SAM-dependent methyltransferase